MNMGAQLWQVQMPAKYQGMAGCAPCAGLGQVQDKPSMPGFWSWPRVLGAGMILSGVVGLGRVGAAKSNFEDLILPIGAIVGGGALALRKRSACEVRCAAEQL